MLTKTTIALAIIVGVTSGALAVTKQQSGTNPAWNVYDNRGHFIGADPAGLVRMQLRLDHGTTE
jgi:hypothetical protein